MDLQLQYEHIDWSDIVDAELSGDQEALRELRSARLASSSLSLALKAGRQGVASSTGQRSSRC